MSAAPKMPESWAPRPSLFALTEEMQALDELLTQSGGELTPEIEAMLASIGKQITHKVDSLAWVVKTCEVRAAGYKKLRDEMDEKKTTEDNKVVRLKEYVRLCLDQLGTTKVSGEVYTFAIQKNGGRPPLKIHEPFVSAPHLLPKELQRVTVTPDTDAVRVLAEKDGGTTLGPFGEVLAEILPAGTHVRVR